MVSGRSSELSICPYCACGCGLYVQRTAGRLTGVMPSEHHPVSAGRLCARGWAAHEPSLWGRRLTQPLLRDGDGRAVATTWPTALRAAAEHLRALRAAGKAVGVLGSGRATNEENFLAAGLARAGLQSGHVDACLRAPYHDLLLGLAAADPREAADRAPPLEALEACDVILLVEGDLALTHPRAAYAILRAVRRGARLVTAGSVRTKLARLAWRHLSLLPGDEVALAAALTGRAPGQAPDGGGGELREVVESYAGAQRAGIVIAPTGADPAGLRALGAALGGLAAATGHVDRPGSVILPLPLRGNTRGALEMGVLPDALPGPSALHDAAARRRLAAAWGQEPATARGLDVERMLDEVAGLVVVADDPPVALPSAERARRALAGLECLVVLDAFVTPTVEAAHVALPIASLAETEGTFTNMEGRVQWLRAGAAPPGAARPGWAVLAALGAELGLARPPASVDDVLAGIRASVPSYAWAERRAGEQEAWTQHALPAVAPAALERPAAPEPAAPEPADASYPFRLVRAAAFEWGDDPLVTASPTLRRDHVSLRKLFPHGRVDLPALDAKALGIRDGWQVKLVSRAGEALIPVNLRDDLAPRTILVSFAFRDQLAPVLGAASHAAVRVERV